MTTMTNCPSWCTDEPGHEYDSVKAGERTHHAPAFSPHLTLGASEHGFVVQPPALFDMDPGSGLDAAGLRRLAADALAAAEWLEANT